MGQSTQSQEALGEFMRAEIITPEKPRKTTVWAVLAANGSQLGIVQWNNHWRRYVFQPMEACMFDAACLAALQEFLTTKTTQYKEK